MDFTLNVEKKSEILIQCGMRTLDELSFLSDKGILKIPDKKLNTVPIFHNNIIDILRNDNDVFFVLGNNKFSDTIKNNEENYTLVDGCFISAVDLLTVFCDACSESGKISFINYDFFKGKEDNLFLELDFEKIGNKAEKHFKVLSALNFLQNEVNCKTYIFPKNINKASILDFGFGKDFESVLELYRKICSSNIRFVSLGSYFGNGCNFEWDETLAIDKRLKKGFFDFSLTPFKFEEDVNPFEIMQIIIPVIKNNKDGFCMF